MTVAAAKRASPGRRLRDLLASEKPVPTVWGGIAQHAQLAEATGFKVFGVSGSNVSTNTLGLPDAGFITLTELAEATDRICQAVNMPVIVDCDTGFGNAINARRTVKSMIRAGAAGLFMEDQVAPKRCGFVKGKEMIPLEEAVGKYKACLDMRDEMDPDFVIIARTDARGAVGGGMDEVFRRGEAYLEAGIDMLYVEALQTREEIRAVRERFPECLLMITTMAIDPPMTQAELRELNVALVGFHIARVGAIAMYDFLTKYQAEGDKVWIDFWQSTKNHPLGGFRIFDLTGFPEVVKLEQKYLPAEKLERYDSSIGAYDPRQSKPAAE
ncbi:MAG: oxaloacetate decarboxylase [Hyphomicrobiaceae bacterium]